MDELLERLKALRKLAGHASMFSVDLTSEEMDELIETLEEAEQLAEALADEHGTS